MDRNDFPEKADSRHALFGLFFIFQNSLQIAGDAFFQEITCKQFFLLLCLKQFGNTPPTINQLADRMGSSHQNVRQMLNKLESSGYIHLGNDKDDRRKQRIIPAKRLNQLKVKYEIKENQFLRRLFDDVTEEEADTLFHLLLKLESNLETIKEECRLRK